MDDKLTIIQETEKVLCKVEVRAYDQRTRKVEDMILYCELTAQEQDAKPIVERALNNLGYLYSGIISLDTTSVPFDAEGMYLFGKEREQEDLANK